MLRIIRYAACLALVLAMNACGTKGALYLPKNPAPAQAGQAQTDKADQQP